MIDRRRIQPEAGQESVWDYPRPPRLELIRKHIRVVLNSVVIAETTGAHRVLETSHPPVYYIPREDVAWEYVQEATGESFCEWKGVARYYDAIVGEQHRTRAAWGYPEPEPKFAAIKGALAFYAHMMDECTVDGERVEPQPGLFYGGWVTRDIVGPFKGLSLIHI